jgi:hypothetical protein
LSIKPLPDGRVLVNPFSPRDDRLTMLRYVEDRLGISGRPAPARVAQVSSKPPPPTATFDPLPLWNACVDPAGTPAEVYLERRGVLDAGRHAFGHAIRFHPNCPFNPGKYTSCMVSLVTDVRTAKPQAIHRTALDIDGNKIEIDGKDRMVLGPIKGGCIRLTRDENVETCLGIGEGVETTLSLQSLPEFGASPIWSCIHADNITNFPVLPGVEVLWIAVDHDAAGIIAAEKCAARWHAAGREVLRLQPEKHAGAWPCYFMQAIRSSLSTKIGP